MISRLYYVSCDGCGEPCGDGDDTTIYVAEARALAKRLGWLRIPGTRYQRGRDYCPTCAVGGAP